MSFFNYTFQNNNTLKIINYKLIDLYSVYKISKFITSNKQPIFNSVNQILLDKKNSKVVTDNINIIVGIIQNYIKVFYINEDPTLHAYYKNLDLKNVIKDFYKETVKTAIYLPKNILYDEFIKFIKTYLNTQDNGFQLTESVTVNGVVYSLSDIKDKIYNIVYNTDIDLFAYTFACDKTCQHTLDLIESLINEINIILDHNAIYNPADIIFNDLNQIVFDFSNYTDLDPNTIYNTIYDFLINNDFDIFKTGIYPQIFIPAQFTSKK